MNLTPQENDLLEQALNLFRENTGLGARIEPPYVGVNPLIPHWRPDAQITVTCGGRSIPYWVVVKKQIDRHATLVAFNELATHGRGLLVTNHMTQELAEHCRAINLQFLDTAGNAYLKQDELFVLIQGQKLIRALAKRETPTRAFYRTGLKVVFALLTAPQLLQATYRDIAKAAGVALGAVGWILNDLRERGFIVEDRHGLRRWVDQEGVIQAWATNYPMRLRKRLNPKRYRAKNEDWWRQADLTKFGGRWGGEVAAARLQGDLIPKTATVYIHGDRTPFLAAHRLVADADGPIEVLDAFLDFPEEPGQLQDLVPPLLVYADLQEIGNPRTYEEAKRIHDHYLV